MGRDALSGTSTIKWKNASLTIVCLLMQYRFFAAIYHTPQSEPFNSELILRSPIFTFKTATTMNVGSALPTLARFIAEKVVVFGQVKSMPNYWVILNHTIFILGGKLFFKSPAGLLSIKRFSSFAVVYLASAAGSLYVLLRHPSRSGLKRFVALVLAGSSSALFTQSVAATRHQPLTPINTTDQPQHLNRHGPYAYVRHPFYSSYILNFLAAAIGSDSPLGYLCLLVISTLR